jgi:hypothetical protein
VSILVKFIYEECIGFLLTKKIIYSEPKVPESWILTERKDQVGSNIPSQVASQEHAGVPQRGYGFQMSFSLSHHHQEGSL